MVKDNTVLDNLWSCGQEIKEFKVMLGATGSSGDELLLTVTVVRDEHGYGMKVSGDNPVYVQSVKEHGAAWRAGLRAGDRILKVDSVAVLRHTHQQVVQMIRANPSTILTVHQNASRHKTPITAPVPVNMEKQRQLEASKVQTVKLMLDQQQKYIRDLRNELAKVPDVRKQAQLESAEQKCAVLQHEIDTIMATQPPSRLARAPATPPSTGFLSGLPRSLSNLTGQSLRNLRQARNQKQELPQLVRQNSDESNHKRRHAHNNTVPMIPTTCLDNVSPPPLPPRSIERPKRTLPSPPMNPMAQPKPSNSQIPQYKGRYYPSMHQSMPAYKDEPKQLRRSAHSLDGELEGPQPNSIALQMSYPLVNAPPPPLQNDNRRDVPVLHVRSQSSPEHLDHELSRCNIESSPRRGTPPPGTPPPPYQITSLHSPHATTPQPCSDPQRAIISMEEDDSPASDNSTYSGLFSNLRSVLDSKARTAVLLNWLLAERRSPYALLLLILTDAFRDSRAPVATLRRWAYEIHSTFVMPKAVLQLNGVDENMANEIEHVLVNEFDKDEILRNVFRKPRQKAKDECTQQLSEFQVKRQVGLGTLYGPHDSVIDKCDVDKTQEAIVVERIMCQRLEAMSSCLDNNSPRRAALGAAVVAAAQNLNCRPTAIAAAAGGIRSTFLQRDKAYKQKLKQLTKQHPSPFIIRGHHLQLHALTAVAHCHHCDNVIWGLAPQAYLCTDCKLRVHRECAKSVEESCCLDGEHHNNRISRFMDRITPNQPTFQDSSDKKSRKSSGTSSFLNMERSFRKMEDEPSWDQTLSPTVIERRDESDESLYESADGHSDAISASDDALPRLIKTPTMSKESLKLAVTDEEVDLARNKKGHRKTMSLSNPLEMVKNFGDEWFDSAKRELDKRTDKNKSRESLWSEEDRDSINGSRIKLDQSRKNSKKEDKSQSNSRKSSTNEPPTRKISKGSSVSALNFLRRKKTPTSMKTVEAVAEAVDKIISADEILNGTRFFLEAEKLHASISESKPVAETDTDDEPPTPTPKPTVDHRRRLSRQASRSKSKARGKSQSVKVNTLRKSHSGTLKKAKKKGAKTPLPGRSRQSSIVEAMPIVKKKNSDTFKNNSWIFSGYRGESRREGSTDDTQPDNDNEANDNLSKDISEKDNTSRTASTNGRGVNRAESCRERDAPRRGKHRNASDPNRLTAHAHHDLEPGAPTAPSGSSSSSSLSSRSNESNTVAADQQASQSDWSEEDEPLPAQWVDSLPPQTLDSLPLSAAHRKRQEVIHELIVSEGSHVRWLKVLATVFHRPLERQPALLPPEDLRNLFPNLSGVRERHGKLYAELRSVRSESSHCVLSAAPVAEALLNTLGDPSYAPCLSRFCRNQRFALDSLRERRRKHKELQQFLCGREHLPQCGRLQLNDLLACVWQRLTKYQLLLESILKTYSEDEDAKDTEVLRRALTVAKEVLHSVDLSIRKAENEHRLRTIQNKLEIRAPNGSEWEELRRLDLTTRTLKYEAELGVRQDNKRTHLLALMLEDCLVLLHREGDKFVLKPIAQSNTQGPLSPLVKWDKVLFRPNAAVRNTFFLMNINGVQMHELSANTAAEYSLWVKHIQGAPLLLTELKPALTHSHQASRSQDDSGINVSRNPSDASEKSDKSDKSDACDKPAKLDSSDVPPPPPPPPGREQPPSRQEREESREPEEKEENNTPRHALLRVGSTCGAGAACPLLDASAVAVLPPVDAGTAVRMYTVQERLRRLDLQISSAMRAKSDCVAEILGIKQAEFGEMAELAVADAHSQLDEYMEPFDRVEAVNPTPDFYQLLLAAQTQANQLLDIVSSSLTVQESSVVAMRTAGQCDGCAKQWRRAFLHNSSSESEAQKPERLSPASAVPSSLSKDISFDMLAELEGHREAPVTHLTESCTSAALLSRRLVPLTMNIQCSLSGLLAALPVASKLRAELTSVRERADSQAARLYQTIQDQSFPKPEDDTDTDTLQEQPSNGG